MASGVAQSIGPEFKPVLPKEEGGGRGRNTIEAGVFYFVFVFVLQYWGLNSRPTP
jgi:hypothetical protein